MMSGDFDVDFDSDDDLDAQDIFVNRGDEREGFDLALQTHHETSTQRGNDPDDSRAPRRNVMVFYGVGGFGKTTLSRHLEDELKERAQQDSDLVPEWMPARINLDSGWDFETMLLGIRARLAPAGPFPTFDIAFSKYWATNHPQEALGTSLKSHAFLRKISGALDLPDQFKTVLETASDTVVDTSLGASAVFNIVSSIAQGLRERRGKQKALTKCPSFAYIFDRADNPEALSLFPKLLAWELYRRKLSLVVFIDGFEELDDRGNRQLEAYINRMVWLMPNAFFLVTGRNRLDWGDADVPRKLDKTGPRNWPGLSHSANEDPRQHLIDELSDADAEQFLQKRIRLKSRDGESSTPLIPGDIRRVIVARAGGWPEYLDLAVTLFRKMRRDGETPSPEDFDKEFEKLMHRICQDLNVQEQAVLRAMSMLDGFDLPLAAAAAGQPEGAAVAFETRSLIRADREGFWPYHLSDAIRSCVRKSRVLRGAWTSRDWADAAGLAVTELGERYRQSREVRDRNAVINYLNQSIRLAHEYDLDLGWITEAACTYVEDYVWEPTLMPQVPTAERDRPISTAAQALGLALIAIRERQVTHRSETLVTLERCLEVRVLTGDAKDLVSYFRAECLRDLGQPDESEKAMARLIGPGRPMSLQASEGVIYANRRNGRFVDARARIDGLPPSPLRSRLLGDLFWNHALFTDSDMRYTESCDLAREGGLFGQQAEAEASRAFALGFEGGQRVDESVARARELLNGARIAWADLQASNAELLVMAGTSPDFEERCAVAMRAGETAGLSSITAYAALASAFDAAIRDDEAGLEKARAQLARLVSGRHFHYLLEIIDFWSDAEPAPADAIDADWLDGAQMTAERWRDVVAARRSQRASAT